MNTFLIAILLTTNILAANGQAVLAERQIPVSQLEVLQGVVMQTYTEDESEMVSIETMDGNIWLLETCEKDDSAHYLDFNHSGGEKVYVVFDNMGTEDIHDDTIVKVINLDDKI